MSMDGFYGVTRKGTKPEALFRALCAQDEIDDVSLMLTPRTFADIQAAAFAFGLGDDFTQVTCSTPLVGDAGEDLVRRLASLPPHALSADDEFHKLTIAYEKKEKTTALWPALGSKRRTAIDRYLGGGVDVLRPAVFFSFLLDYSMVSRLKDGESKAIQQWWKKEQQAFLDEHGLTGFGPLDDQQHPPIRRRAVPAADLLAEGRKALRHLEPLTVEVTLHGPATALCALSSWLPPPSRIHGPSPFDDVKLSTLKLPDSFSGEASLSALIGDEDTGGDLMLFLGGGSPRLTLAVRWGLDDKQQKALEKKYKIQLDFEHAD